MNNSERKWNSGGLYGVATLVFLVFSVSLVMGQSYQSQYIPVNTSPDNGSAGKGTLTQKGESLVLLGSYQAIGRDVSVPVLTVSGDGTVVNQFAIVDPLGAPGVELEGVAVSDDGEGEYYIGINRDQSGHKSGLITRTDPAGKIRWATEWNAIDIKDLVYNPSTGVTLAIANGEDTRGQQDFQLGLFDPEGHTLVTRSILTASEDAATGAVALPKSGSFLVSGSMKSRDLSPFLAKLTSQGEIEWGARYQLGLEVISVGDVAYLASEEVIGLTGTAVNVNRDTTAFLLVTDVEGVPIRVVYYELSPRFQGFGATVAAVDDPNGYRGFVIGGQIKLPALSKEPRSLLIHTDAYGYPVWTRTYGSFDNTDLTADGFSHVSYSSSTGEFAAVGFETYAPNGTLDEFRLKVVKAKAIDGDAGRSVGLCSDDLEVVPVDGEALAFSEGYTEVTGSSNNSALRADRLRWDVDFCSYPLRSRTIATEVENTQPIGSYHAEVFDMQGRQVWEETVKEGATLRLPAELPLGVYIVHKVVDGMVVESQKVSQVQP